MAEEDLPDLAARFELKKQPKRWRDPCREHFVSEIVFKIPVINTLLLRLCLHKNKMIISV